MSYDTTVHDALDPPQPRIAESSGGPRGRRSLRNYVPSAMRSLLATVATISTFGVVTWVVAHFTTAPLVESTQPVQNDITDSSEELRITAGENTR